MWPLMQPLLLAVPLTVWTRGPLLGRLTRRTGLLTVAEERVMSNTRRGGIQQRGFDELVPIVPHDCVHRTARRRGSGWVLATATLLAMVVLPKTALSPGLPDDWRKTQVAMVQHPGARSAGVADTVRANANPAEMIFTVRANAATKARRSLQLKAARMFDDDIRRRAYEAVAQAIDNGWN